MSIESELVGYQLTTPQIHDSINTSYVHTQCFQTSFTLLISFNSVKGQSHSSFTESLLHEGSKSRWSIGDRISDSCLVSWFRLQYWKRKLQQGTLRVGTCTSALFFQMDLQLFYTFHYITCIDSTFYWAIIKCQRITWGTIEDRNMNITKSLHVAAYKQKGEVTYVYNPE